MKVFLLFAAVSSLSTRREGEEGESVKNYRE